VLVEIGTGEPHGTVGFGAGEDRGVDYPVGSAVVRGYSAGGRLVREPDEHREATIVVVIQGGSGGLQRPRRMWSAPGWLVRA